VSLTVTAHQLTFAPWPGLFAKVAKADVCVLLDDVQVEQGGYENRVRIRTANGTQWLTVPLRHTGTPQRMCDVRVADNGGRWRRKHMRTWEMAYGRAFHSGPHLEFLRTVYEREWEQLVDLNEHILRYLIDVFGLAPRIVHLGALGLVSSGSQLVLDICKSLGADRYVFGARGRDYADPGAFRDAGVEVEFQAYEPVPYPQVWRGPFEPGLSAFDLLMNVPRDEAVEIMRGA
jgi:hypothetical protein